jgi:hypothetical protein
MTETFEENYQKCVAIYNEQVSNGYVPAVKFGTYDKYEARKIRKYLSSIESRHDFIWDGIVFSEVTYWKWTIILDYLDLKARKEVINFLKSSNIKFEGTYNIYEFT